ncbi:hypothetical protein R3P38DRAFT_3253013 [Favolaschia claudopus]|uniref:C2H2-type domain-containing protein n=1 Tax=Favolaschia claudopus TaxID=2862362 RepID=A0AAW0E0U0_9AGAR
MPRIPTQTMTSLRKRSKSTTAKNGKTPPYPPLQHKCSHEGCDWSYKNPTDLSRHTARHLSPEEREKLMHHCPFPGCTHKSLQKSNMKTHYTSKHTTEKPYACNQCDFGTSDPSCYHRHMCGQHGYVPRTEPRKRKSAARDIMPVPDVVVVESEAQEPVEVPVASGSGFSSPSPSAAAASPFARPVYPLVVLRAGLPLRRRTRRLPVRSRRVSLLLLLLGELISLFASPEGIVTPDVVNPKDLLYVPQEASPTHLYPVDGSTECKAELEKSDFSAYTQGRFEANVFLPTSDPSLSLSLSPSLSPSPSSSHIAHYAAATCDLPPTTWYPNHIPWTDEEASLFFASPAYSPPPPPAVDVDYRFAPASVVDAALNGYWAPSAQFTGEYSTVIY